MRRACAAFAGLLLALSACSDEGLNPIVGAVVTEVNPFGGDADETPTAGVAPPDRAAIERADIATIRARLVEEENATYLFATSNNGGYITYASSLRQTLTLRGSQITGTRGLGFDLLSAASSSPDPLNRPIPVAQWPETITRSYQFPADGPRGRIETFECRFEVNPPKEIVILQQRHRGYEVAEYCVGETEIFENLHFADVTSGFVWRSLQWLGPRQGLIDLEIVLPYTGD